MRYLLINSVEEIKSVCSKSNGDFHDFFISLAGGLARSSKRIRYDKETTLFDIHNEIDDTFQDDLSEIELKDKTMIVEAIEKKSFFYSEF